MSSPVFSFLRSRYALAAGLLWAVWYGVALGIRAWFRSIKDAGDYTGICYKPNGYAVNCSMENWLVWDATPWVEIYLVVGAILVAAVTGWLFLKHRARSR